MKITNYFETTSVYENLSDLQRQIFVDRAAHKHRNLLWNPEQHNAEAVVAVLWNRETELQAQYDDNKCLSQWVFENAVLTQLKADYFWSLWNYCKQTQASQWLEKYPYTNKGVPCGYK